MQIELPTELRDITDIYPYPHNPRVNDAAVAAVAASIREFGFRQPLVIDEAGVIVMGHTRYKAARQLGLQQVPVHVVRGLSPEQIKALRIADNKTADLADWDYTLLAQELAQLKDLDFDLSTLGFSAEELTQLLDGELLPGLVDPDDIPDPPEEARTRVGDLWLLGEHRLLCGDSAKGEDVDRLLGGAPVHLVHSDPPYGVHVEPRSQNAIRAGLSSFAAGKRRPRRKRTPHAEPAKPVDRKLRARDRPLENDFLPESDFNRLLHSWFAQLAKTLVPGGSFYLWGGYSNLPNYPPALAANGLYFSQAIIWNKLHPVLTRKDFMGCFELAFYGWREGAAHKFYGPPNALDLWEVKKVNPQSMIHLTEKPVELAVRAIQYSSRPGENVLDAFGGSGSTLMAAQRTGRRAFVMELDPLYVDVIVERWQKFSGHTAQRAA